MSGQFTLSFLLIFKDDKQNKEELNGAHINKQINLIISSPNASLLNIANENEQTATKQ